MDEHPATLNPSLKPTQGGDVSVQQPSQQEQHKRIKGMRFTYPSGATPLEGYTIKRGIGIGGFGEVYFALSDAGKEVALKRIQRNLDVELRGVRQCLNLKHVNLIKLWDIRSNEQGESWVVMEYVPGDSLRDVIERHPQGMPDDKLRHWFDSVCAGVTYLHDRGIVHRDLKPGNIFRDDDEQVIKIGDYGLSKYISCSNRDGQTESVGTFHYMAPEIGKGVYGKEIDVYAMGIILFEMVTGRVPFEGESSQEIIMKHLTANPDLAGLRDPYQQVIAKALTKDPERRFSNVPEMLKMLNASQQEIVVTARDNKSIATPPHPGAVTRSNTNSKVPPIQPMFIGDLAQPFESATDSEISFGEVRQVVDASVYQSNVPPPSQRANTPQPDVRFSATANDRVPDEPIARAVKGGWDQTTRWWSETSLTTPVKVLLLVGIGILLLMNSLWLLPTSIGLGLVYLLYFTIRTVLAPAGQAQPKVSKAERMAQLRTGLAKRPASDRFTEAIGSLVVASAACLVLGFFALAATTTGTTTGSQIWAYYTWTVIVSLTGTWAMLIASKTWEHRKGEDLMRRFVMLSAGVLTGLIAFAAGQFLHLNWDPASDYSEPMMSPLPEGPFVAGNGPTLIGCVVFFGTLFVLLRWWKNADPVRRTRLSIWSIGLCLIWGMLVGQLFHFPLPWSCLFAVMIGIATQVAAPWLTVEQRASLQKAR